MTRQGRLDTPSLYENYPAQPTAASPEPRIAKGAGRGAVTGMAAAALTVLGVLPTHFAMEVAPISAAFLLLFYAVMAAIVGAGPGAAVGWLLSALARAGGTRLPIRLIGGLAAATTATLANAPLQILNWPGVVIATLCGAFAAPWVAWGSDRPTLA